MLKLNLSVLVYFVTWPLPTHSHNPGPPHPRGACCMPSPWWEPHMIRIPSHIENLCQNNRIFLLCGWGHDGNTNVGVGVSRHSLTLLLNVTETEWRGTPTQGIRIGWSYMHVAPPPASGCGSKGAVDCIHHGLLVHATSATSGQPALHLPTATACQTWSHRATSSSAPALHPFSEWGFVVGPGWPQLGWCCFV